ncbi:hypothetical protein [Vreelandella massiliensis]|uniref:hypothetical protein n=1 Tax=Vreelandella massiliensis TaxID=1816686 RepID=UPI001181C25B|nr:hypothetical protein [Halomonas massiliensis]
MNKDKVACPNAQVQSLKNERPKTLSSATAAVSPTPLVPIIDHFGTVMALDAYIGGRGGVRLNELTWIVGEARVSLVPIPLDAYARLGLDPEPIEAGWAQFRLGGSAYAPRLHRSPQGKVWIEFLGYDGLDMSATLGLYTREQLDALLTAYLGCREVVA